jgi:hypothetical protein
MTEQEETSQRRSIRLWQEEHPRDQMGLVALAAWLNVTPEQMPEGMRLHTCQATKDAWARVELAVRNAVKDELSRAVSFEEVDAAVVAVGEQNTGATWLDTPLQIAKAVRCVLQKRLAGEEKQDDRHTSP